MYNVCIYIYISIYLYAYIYIYIYIQIYISINLNLKAYIYININTYIYIYMNAYIGLYRLGCIIYFSLVFSLCLSCSHSFSLYEAYILLVIINVNNTISMCSYLWSTIIYNSNMGIGCRIYRIHIFLFMYA